jgi:16S rRNA processing protein RimM
LSNQPERFQRLREVYLFGSEGARGEDQPLEVEAVREYRGGLIFKFRGVDSIAEAERLRGAEVRLPFAERASLPADEYYHSDLIGCEVVERNTDERLGVVVRMHEYGGPGLLEVERPGEPLLIPFARAICVEIDIGRRRIVVELPEGLKELSG